MARDPRTPDETRQTARFIADLAAAMPCEPSTTDRNGPAMTHRGAVRVQAASAGFGAALGPPLATPTSAGRSTRSPMT